MLDLFPRKTVSIEAQPINEALEVGPSNHEPEVLTTSKPDADTEDSERTGATTDRIKLREFSFRLEQSDLF